MAESIPSDVLVVGRVSGVFGTRGWLKLWSHTRPPRNLLTFDPWLIGTSGQWQSMKLIAGREHGSSLIAQIHGITDRDAAAALIGKSIAVDRAQLPPLAQDEYYWADLIGMSVVNRQGSVLGEVKRCHETGSADVLEVAGKHEYLIPFVRGVYVDAVDRAARRIVVDWQDPD